MGRRGKPNSIELLPEDADEDVAWAVNELNAHKRTQEDIREEFNLRLLSKGIDPVSRSAFNRYSVELSRTGRKMLQAREIASIFAEKMDEQPSGDVGLLLSETIKTLVYDVVIDSTLNGESPSIKMLLAAAEAVERLEKARSSNIRTAALKKDKFIEDAADTAEKVAKESGLSGDAAANIRREVLGVRKKGG